MKFFLGYFVGAFIFMSFGNVVAHADDLRFDITGGHIKPISISIAGFHAMDEASRQISNDINEIIQKNFQHDGYFEYIPKQYYPQSASSLMVSRHFPKWRKINSQALVFGSAETQNDGRVKVYYEVWDVDSGQRVSGTALYTVQKNWRRIAHIISDKIYKDLTGVEGYFDSRIVFVSEGKHEKAKKQLALMDQDGAEIRYLTTGQNLVSTPRFSPSFDKIVYVEFIRGFPQVQIMNPITLHKYKLGNLPGITFAPRFSPDGKKVVLSHAKDGNTDIYEVDLSSQKVTKITRNLAIDTAPCYSPDGNQIVFESDRGGREGDQQIYVKNLLSGDLKRISFGTGRYATPVWSPVGNLVAFTKMYQGRFYIGVMRPDGSGEKILAESFHVEGPSWSPNGKVLTYFQKAKNNNGFYQSKLYAIDINGLHKREIPTPSNASDPGWSMNLQN